MININRRAIGALTLTPANGSAQFSVQLAGLPVQVSVRLDIARQGPPGPTVSVSTDASNRLRYGSDAGLYVPDDLTPDPLAYYILSKS